MDAVAGHVDPELLRTARRTALAHAQRQIDAEAAAADDLRTSVLPRLRAAIAEARAERSIGRAWLFGSFAWGLPTDRSDVDLLVESRGDPLGLAGHLGGAVGRDAHVIPLERAPESLVARALAEGIEL